MSEGFDTKQRVLLLTGAPGVGKTTVIRRVAESLGPNQLRGFYTEEIREDGERRGFCLISFNRTAHVIAHVNFPKTHAVGKYGVDVRALDDAARLLRPQPEARIYLVDEIGKMECLSDRFVAAMRALLFCEAPVVATVGARGEGFIAEVKRLPECELWEVTASNRNDLPARIVAWLGRKSGPPDVRRME